MGRRKKRWTPDALARKEMAINVLNGIAMSSGIHTEQKREQLMLLKERTSLLFDRKPLLIGGVSRCPIIQHFGSKNFDTNMFLPVKNGGWNKPKQGGFWTSPIDSEWGWKDWCEAEDFRDCEDSNSITLRIDSKAKILVIDSWVDLHSAPTIKGIVDECLDFEEIARMYDAIWLTAKGERATRFSKPITLYGWDCETVLILNPKCCTPIP